LLIDGAILALVIGKKLSVFSAMQNADDGISHTSRNRSFMSACGPFIDTASALPDVCS
jgi:hypothetical protein